MFHDHTIEMRQLNRKKKYQKAEIFRTLRRYSYFLPSG